MVSGLDELDPAQYQPQKVVGPGGAGGSGAAGAAESGGSAGDGGAGGIAVGGAGGGGGVNGCVASTLFTQDYGGCAKLDSGEVHCWGYQALDWGECSVPFSWEPIPTHVPLFDTVTDYSSYSQTCVIDAAGQALCAGENGACQVVPFDNVYAVCPYEPVALPGPASQVDTNAAASCALVAGELYCWGDGASVYGFGYGGATCMPPTKHLESGSDNAELALAFAFRCLRKTDSGGLDGGVYCVGKNDQRQLGIDSSVDQATPVRALIPVDEDVIDVEVGDSHALALTAAGDVWCWGARDSSLRQCGGFGVNDVPSKVAGLAGVTEVSAGYDHSCAVLADRTLLCWGEDVAASNGPGVGPTVIELEGQPFKVREAGSPNASRVAAGIGQTCAIHENGAVYCWGWNRFYLEFGEGDPGLLGTGSLAGIVESPEPVLISCGPGGG